MSVALSEEEVKEMEGLLRECGPGGRGMVEAHVRAVGCGGSKSGRKKKAKAKAKAEGKEGAAAVASSMPTGCGGADTLPNPVEETMECGSLVKAANMGTRLDGGYVEEGLHAACVAVVPPGAGSGDGVSECDSVSVEEPVDAMPIGDVSACVSGPSHPRPMSPRGPDAVPVSVPVSVPVAVSGRMGFEDMGLSRPLLRGIAGYGFTEPSAIQASTIPALVAGRDVLAQGQSGTGKTGAFVIGVLHRVDPGVPGVQALILCPGLELAVQIREVARCVGAHTGVVVHGLVSGSRVSEDVRALRGSAHVIVGTPGRVYDYLSRGLLSLDHVRVVVVDEADKMLEEGEFLDQTQAIFRRVAASAQVAVFSATMPPGSVTVAKQALRDPVEVLVPAEGVTLAGIKQVCVRTHGSLKLDYVCDVLEAVEFTKTVVFVNKRSDVEWLVSALRERGFGVAGFHGDLRGEERESVMGAFRAEGGRVLVSTDTLARGIDVQQVGLVVNFSLPRTRETYVHRIGRCGRFGRVGVAVSLVSARDEGTLADIEAGYGRVLRELSVEDVAALASMLKGK